MWLRAGNAVLSVDISCASCDTVEELERETLSLKHHLMRQTREWEVLAASSSGANHLELLVHNLQEDRDAVIESWRKPEIAQAAQDELRQERERARQAEDGEHERRRLEGELDALRSTMDAWEARAQLDASGAAAAAQEAESLRGELELQVRSHVRVLAMKEAEVEELLVRNNGLTEKLAEQNLNAEVATQALKSEEETKSVNLFRIREGKGLSRDRM